MRQLTLLLIVIIILAVALFCGCTTREEAPSSHGGQQTIGNPASLYCHSLGYHTEIRTDANGSQYGVCCMPNGTEVDEWVLYRQGHPEA